MSTPPAPMLRSLRSLARRCLPWQRTAAVAAAPVRPGTRAGAGLSGVETIREMVSDPMCGAFVARQSALTTIADGKVWFFCSSPCYRDFLLRTRRAAR